MNEVQCPLCGQVFLPSDTQAACQACPMHSGCSLVCCPNCGHTTVDPTQSRMARWMTRLLRRGQRRGRQPIPLRAITLRLLPPGHRGRVIGFDGLSTPQKEHLQAYGLTPGRLVQVLQHAPETIVQVDQTELALEAHLAERIRISYPAEFPLEIL